MPPSTGRGIVAPVQYVASNHDPRLICRRAYEGDGTNMERVVDGLLRGIPTTGDLQYAQVFK